MRKILAVTHEKWLVPKSWQEFLRDQPPGDNLIQGKSAEGHWGRDPHLTRGGDG